MKRRLTQLCAGMLVLAASIMNFAGAQDMKHDDQRLTPQEQSIVLIAAFTANGDLNKLKDALNKGLDDGLTINEIKEVLIQMYAYAGFPRSLNGITTFMTVVETRKQNGINDSMGEEPKPIPANINKYDIGRDNLTRLTHVQPETTPSGSAAFAPGIDVFLKEHLFTDIFERGVLDFKLREIATIGALSSLKGVEPMLQAHLNMGMNVGLTEAQLQQLMGLIRSHVGSQEANVADDVLSRVIINRK